MRRVIILLVVTGLFVVVATAGAWNKSGHMTSAAIAYADLKENNPVVLDKVVQILQQHPQFESKWAHRLSQVAPEDRDLYIFMLAAKWPDDARGDDDFDHPGWHYVNIPYRPGQNGINLPKGDSILTALPENSNQLKSAASDNEARAVATCWVMHLTGDIHQPLHSTKLVTAQFPEPEGDRGGTRFYIRAEPNRSTISLHKFWDDLVLGSERLQSVKNRATELRNKPDLKREKFADQLSVKDSNEWAKAGYALAGEHAYLKGQLKGSKNQDDGIVLPNDYKGQATDVAERQIVLAGYRISDAMVDACGQ
jgi:hypothetical protein